MKSNNTVQKRILKEALCSVYTHPTAEELYEMTRIRLPRISLATVYRNLEQLSARGEILCLEFAGRQRRYDGNPIPHLHTRCNECGAVDDFHLCREHPLSKALQSTLLEHHFSDFQLEFRKTCPTCQRSKQTFKPSNLKGDSYVN